jgi:hypothetical protein
MQTIEFAWDTQASAFLEERRIQKAVFKAAKKAGRDALRALRAEAKRLTRARVRIRAGYLANKALPLTTVKATKMEDLEWRMDVSGAAVPLGEYPARRTKRGVSVEVERGRRAIIKGAFLAKTQRTKRKGVFKRPTAARYPMGHRLGLRVSDSMRDGRIPNAALKYSARVFTRAVNRLMDLELERRR